MAIQQIDLGTEPTGVGGDTNRSAMIKINNNFSDSTNAASRLVGTAPGNVMEVGAFGLGGLSTRQGYDQISVNGFYQTPPFAGGSGPMVNKAIISVVDSGSIDNKWQIGIDVYNSPNMAELVARVCSRGVWSPVAKIYNSHNTQVDPNGFIKAASPIVSVYANRIELNSEAKLQDIKFEKLGVGDYLVKGSLGFAQEGWYIEMPKDANGNVLVAVVYKQLDNNDISVKTYDYMLNKKGRIVPDLETPLDIPDTRWIDLRLQALPQPDIKPFSTDETVTTDA